VGARALLSLVASRKTTEGAGLGWLGLLVLLGRGRGEVEGAQRGNEREENGSVGWIWPSGNRRERRFDHFLISGALFECEIRIQIKSNF